MKRKLLNDIELEPEDDDMIVSLRVPGTGLQRWL